ncbi:uncharacterized protein BO80DRAFT_422655 [Aspergillus ibericus CBS 121593]|uniref:Uncharacterized protein n=1 Tax=Aspergillus ibericus CBS 121593 TaxID=1448316 RepID=A0A395H840_9EURO|nr:hypothetical protein BO80DRAFT_422655 [Aspergillus ibericus CBS 121593]RAL03729.1 hypothetical protein BO80DRAFT_422655 [Aspergillus ibericus CBS 121593]
MDDQLRVERKARRQALNAIYGQLGGLDHRLLPAQFKQVKINHTRMPLDADNAPYYFSAYPYPIDEPEYEYPEDAEDWPEFDGCPYKNAEHLAICLNRFLCRCEIPDEGTHPPRFEMSSWGNFNFQDLGSVTLGSQWQVESIWYDANTGSPHMVALMWSELAQPQNEELCRGEVDAAIMIMHGRLRDPALRPHVIAPVLLLSAIGEHYLRVIEAYFDKGQLTMRSTPLMDMRERDLGWLIALARWCWGGPSSKNTQLIKS